MNENSSVRSQDENSELTETETEQNEKRFYFIFFVELKMDVKQMWAVLKTNFNTPKNEFI